jgi:GrpB-like predicted nucleotidyltransferase (UPF0157 family)
MNAADIDPVLIITYDDAWPDRFEQERLLLQQAIGRWVVGSIEHIGSTAVPGLAAKPVIDIMVGVESLDASRPALPVLEALGYCYAPYRAESMHWFCKPSLAVRTHHLHLVPLGSRLWVERLAFRDYLRAHRDVASEYAELKRRLAEQYRFDRDAYTDAKSEFISRIVERALTEWNGPYRLDAI